MDMTFLLLKALRLSVGSVTSGIVGGMSEGLRSVMEGAAASCGEGSRRLEGVRQRRTLAVTGAWVEEWRRESCMDERVFWKERGRDT